ncbi:hypothetical protein QE152_g18893 [Popillia japonica]|uniref:Uncharacterized protein n=1 Tax=Popillia japonica TaxID=7064 RepID=A0AAW1L556_POPJA
MFDFFPLNLCKFMPYEMDVKYNVFIITLHSFLAIISLIAFLLTCYNYYASKKDGFEYVKKSNSDLSELSIGSTTNHHYQRPYYEGYSTTSKTENGQSHAICRTPWNHWTSDMSNISTTVSSTNSRRPCLGKQTSEDDTETVGLETILPILTVCYLFNHVPVIVSIIVTVCYLFNHVPVIILCLFPWFIAPWSVATAALCLGLLQDVLVPLSLGLVDTRFCQWVSNVYRCTDRDKLNDKLPQVGLDGKFRPFGTHSTEMGVTQIAHSERQKTFPTVLLGNEPKFPITNGSLYTSVDGRIPIIHNYRRHKDRNVKAIENNLINLGVHATYLKQHQQDLQSTISTVTKREYACSTCDDQKKKQIAINIQKKRVSLSQNGINRLGLEISSHKRNMNQLRLSKSEDSLCGKFDQKMLLRCEKPEASDSDDDYFSDTGNLDVARVSDDESSKSSYSITTEANCDFEFYQTKSETKYDDYETNDFTSSHSHQTYEYLHQEEPKQEIPILQTFKPQMIPRISTSKDNITVVSMEHHLDRPSVVKLDVNRNFRITRSNSKRSLENFKAYIDDNTLDTSDTIALPNHTQRSYSYVDLDDTVRNNNVGNKFESAWTGLDLTYTKDVLGGKNNKQMNTGGSVPDLKKIFISDYL